MKNSPSKRQFIGRQKELESLNLLPKKKSASLVVIRGRRRVGKSRLILEFVKDKNHLIFIGLPPLKTSREKQLELFCSQLSQNLKVPKMQIDSWSECFTFLANQTKNKKIIIVLDEISWIGSEDHQFLGYLKNAWDFELSLNPNLILILCGSVSTWIEENILSHTGFVGRVSLDIALEELSIAESQQFWGKYTSRVSAYEKFKILAVTGGIPKYLEEILPEQSAEANIQRLCFQSEGLLYREYDQIFSDLFSTRSALYGHIIRALGKKSLALDEICKTLEIKKSGNISRYLHDLVLSGFVAEDSTWNLKNKKSSILKKFRLKDNYLRFYLRYIDPNKAKIAKGLFGAGGSLDLPGWETIMGLQFENLIVNNLKELLKILKIELRDVVMAAPFFQRKTSRQKGCQIDLLIQTRHNALYICEVKFSLSEVKTSVVEEMENKIKSLAVPRSYSLRSILIHVNGVSDSVIEKELFSDIVDFSSFLKT